MKRLGQMPRVVGVLAGLTVAATLAVATPAYASDPVFTECPTVVQANADGTFTFQCTVKNNGYPGSVEILAAGLNNVQIQPIGHHVFDSGEEYTFTVTGRLVDPTQGGSFRLVLKYQPDRGDQVLAKRRHRVKIVHG
jgi:hypothetical protein